RDRARRRLQVRALMRLPTRIAAIGVAALALTVTVVALLTYQIVRVSGLRDVDRLLRQEREELEASFPPLLAPAEADGLTDDDLRRAAQQYLARSEEHTSELQSRENLVCRLLLEK